MKHFLLVGALAVLAGVAGCTQSEQAPPTVSAASSPKAESPAPGKPAHGLSDDQLKKIASSGKVGIWADPSDLCSQSSKKRTRFLVAWNVTQPAGKKVSVRRIGKDGQEHRFARGGAIGGRITSAPSGSENVFVLRDHAGKELGRVQVDDKQCAKP